MLPGICLAFLAAVHAELARRGYVRSDRHDAICNGVATVAYVTMASLSFYIGVPVG